MDVHLGPAVAMPTQYYSNMACITELHPLYNIYMFMLCIIIVAVHAHVVCIVAGMRVHERVHTRAAIASHRVLTCHSVESHDVSSSLSGDRSPL